MSAATGLRLAFLRGADGEIKSVAGFRTGEWLAVAGKYLEIEDLATKSGARSRGGGALFDWLFAHAKETGCTHLRRVSNVVYAATRIVFTGAKKWRIPPIIFR